MISILSRRVQSFIQAQAWSNCSDVVGLIMGYRYGASFVPKIFSLSSHKTRKAEHFYTFIEIIFIFGTFVYTIMKSWENLGKFHVWQQRCATVCLEVFRQWIHDQIVSGCALKPDFACLNFNMPYLLKLQGTHTKAVTHLWVRELCLRLEKGLQLQPD